MQIDWLKPASGPRPTVPSKSSRGPVAMMRWSYSTVAVPAPPSRSTTTTRSSTRTSVARPCTNRTPNLSYTGLSGNSVFSTGMRPMPTQTHEGT